MHCYCTLFDKNYLSRGLTLYHSLQRHEPGVKVVLLCLDGATHEALVALSLAHAVLVPLAELESYDPALRKVRGGRSPAEYYFTCKPALMRYVALHDATVTRVTYLDSDLFCFSRSAALAADLERATVALTPHRFPDYLRGRERYGLFNAGWVSASTDEEGTAFIEWWRGKCLEWCKLEAVDDRFADQKYLNQAVGIFPRALALPHIGVNAGPWNLAGARIDSSSNEVHMDGQTLVFFHFHGFRRIAGKWFDSGLHEYRVPLSRELRKFIYAPYMAELCAAEETLQRLPEGIRRNLAARRVRRGLVDWLRYAKKICGVFMSRTAMIG